MVFQRTGFPMTLFSATIRFMFIYSPCLRPRGLAWQSIIEALLIFVLILNSPLLSCQQTVMTNFWRLLLNVFYSFMAFSYEYIYKSFYSFVYFLSIHEQIKQVCCGQRSSRSSGKDTKFIFSHYGTGSTSQCSTFSSPPSSFELLWSPRLPTRWNISMKMSMHVKMKMVRQQNTSAGS